MTIPQDTKLTAEPNLLLRQFRMSDVEILYEAASTSIREVSVWMPWCHEKYSIQDSKTWIASLPETWENGSQYAFGIFDQNSGDCLGSCGINFFNKLHRFANIGYWVRSDATKRGVATAATVAVAKFGFERLELNRLEIVAAVGNVGSQRVAEKAGATREGVQRNRMFMNGKSLDAVMFSLTPTDFGMPLFEAANSLPNDNTAGDA